MATKIKKVKIDLIKKEKIKLIEKVKENITYNLK